MFVALHVFQVDENNSCTVLRKCPGISQCSGKKSSSEHTSQIDFIPRERRCGRKDSGEHAPGKKDGDSDSERDGELHLGWVGDARIGEGG